MPLPWLCTGRQSVISFCYEAQVFRVSQYHFAHWQRPIFGAHGTRRQDFEGKFSKNFRGWYADPFAGGATPFHTHRQYNLLLCGGLKRPIAGTQTIVPMVPNLCPSKNNLLSPPLFGGWSKITMAPSLLLAPLSSTLLSLPSPLFPPPLLLEVRTL